MTLCESCWEPREELRQCRHCGLMVCTPCFERAHDCTPSHAQVECRSSTADLQERRKVSLEWASLRRAALGRGGQEDAG